MDFIYSDADRLAQVAASAVVAYAAVVLLLRIGGKRTLSDMNAFDFVVTVALGTMLGSTILTDGVSVSEGVLGLSVLVALQALIAALSARSSAVRRVVKAEPTLVVHRGAILRNAMRAQRLSEAEVLAAIRAAGEADLGDVHAVVLETNGNLSVVSAAPGGDGAALAAARLSGVPGHPPEPR
jgi:uncharacterized membrane protein YcaP (DUF421 family)